RLLKRVLPERWAYAATRWKNVLLQSAMFQLARRRPRFVKGLIRRGVMRHLPSDFPVDTHFRPRYNPWDQRLCLVPDADLFAALRAGTVSVVTDHIDTFTEMGIALASGVSLPADIIVTATGLKLKRFGGLMLTVDGRPIDVPSLMV